MIGVMWRRRQIGCPRNTVPRWTSQMKCIRLIDPSVELLRAVGKVTRRTRSCQEFFDISKNERACAATS